MFKVIKRVFFFFNGINKFISSPSLVNLLLEWLKSPNPLHFGQENLHLLVPTRDQLLASAWGAATSAPSSDLHVVALLHHCSWSNRGLQVQTTFAANTFVDDLSCSYEWKSTFPTLFFCFPENSVTFLLAEKCRG